MVKDPKNDKIAKVIHQVNIGFKTNMYSMIIKNPRNECKILERSQTNDRMLAQRADGFQKNTPIVLNTTKDKGAFANDCGEFGKNWATKYKGASYKYPSVNEVMQGLMEWYTRQVESRIDNIETMDPAEIKNISIRLIRNSRYNFTALKNALDFTEEEMNKPMK